MSGVGQGPTGEWQTGLFWARDFAPTVLAIIHELELAMAYPLTRPRLIANIAAVTAAACAVSPAFAAISLPTEQWSSYLLYGSIALLVVGVVAKMLTYRNGARAETARQMPNEGGVTIGMYRNKILSPGN
jgi:hypothetical protein